MRAPSHCWPHARLHKVHQTICGIDGMMASIGVFAGTAVPRPLSSDNIGNDAITGLTFTGNVGSPPRAFTHGLPAQRPARKVHHGHTSAAPKPLRSISNGPQYLVDGAPLPLRRSHRSLKFIYKTSLRGCHEQTTYEPAMHCSFHGAVVYWPLPMHSHDRDAERATTTQSRRPTTRSHQPEWTSSVRHLTSTPSTTWAPLDTVSARHLGLSAARPRYSSHQQKLLC